MTQILDQIILWVEALILALGYPGIALVMFLECVFPPIPSEVIMPFAGFLAGRGQMHIAGVIAAGTLGSLAGAYVLYLVGRWAEDHLVLNFVRQYGRWFLLTEDDWHHALKVFEKYGWFCVFFGRLMPIVRSLISIPAGMDHLPVGKFLFFTALGTLIWNTALAVAGLFFGERWEVIMVFVEENEWPVFVILGLIGAGIAYQYGKLVWARLKARNATKGV